MREQSMLEALKRFFTAPPEKSTESDEERVRVAACAVLLEIAHSDGEFSDDERLHIEEALTRHFALTRGEARDLMAVSAARRREATDLHQFTSALTSRYDEGQRMTLAEELYRVVFADGALSRHEEYLMQKLARLLELRPGYMNAARVRAARASRQPPRR